MPVRELNIRQKLLVVTMVTIAVSLVLAGTGIVVWDSILFKRVMQRDLFALASIVAGNSTAALEFESKDEAEDTLALLKSRPHIDAACVYKLDKTLFAQYHQTGSTRQCGPPTLSESVHFTGDELVATHRITWKGELIGSLTLHYDLAEIAERTRLYIEIVLGILLASSVIAFMLSSRLRETITAPISRLAHAAAAVSQTGDYSVRVEKYTNDETGDLVDSFNEMLTRVQSRDIEIQNARYSLQTTLTSIADAVISTDKNGCIVFANPVAQSLLRLNDEELLGKHIGQVFRTVDESTHREMEAPVHKVLRDGTAAGSQNHTLLVAANRTEIPIDESAAPIRNASGEITGAVLVFRDISHWRDTEKLLEAQSSALRQRAQQLKEADERKDQFLAMLAHELRNPLAPIRNAVHVLKAIGSMDSNQRWAGEIIERQAQHLAHMVDDLLDVSRISRGKVKLQTEVLELSAVVSRAVETIRPMVDTRRHHLAVSIPNEPVHLSGDLTRLVQAVGNILNNASKFTDEGGTISLDARQEDHQVVIRVVDNGIGLPAELVPHVFELFTQADRSLDRSQGGLGIGLTVARNLVELHGGRVEARSDGAGKGSEFIIYLPALESTAHSDKAQEPQSGTSGSEQGKLRILVLEDNVDSAEMLRFLLKLEGHDVQIAYDGAEGLETSRTFQPHVILCDIGLPGMNGFEVAGKLRANPDFGKMRLIAISGYGQDEDRRRSRDAGFDYHLTKPVEPGALIALIQSFQLTFRSEEKSSWAL